MKIAKQIASSFYIGFSDREPQNLPPLALLNPIGRLVQGPHVSKSQRLASPVSIQHNHIIVIDIVVAAIPVVDVLVECDGFEGLESHREGAVRFLAL